MENSMSKFKPPKEMWAYVADYLDDGSPVWCLAETLDEIPEDQSGSKIAKYTLSGRAIFVIHREAK